MGVTVKQIKKDSELLEVPSSHRRALAKTLDEYERKAPRRDTAIVKAYASGGFSMKEIGNYFGLHYSSVNRIVADTKRKT